MTLDALPTTRAVPDDEPAVSDAGTGQDSSSPDSLQLFVDPSQALQAARRMEANCRTGLRFFSDFRRVRPLDSFQLDDDGEALEAADEELDLDVPEGRFNLRFDPVFSRR